MRRKEEDLCRSLLLPKSIDLECAPICMVHNIKKHAPYKSAHPSINNNPTHLTNIKTLQVLDLATEIQMIVKLSKSDR
jgi:hypothetical protein